MKREISVSLGVTINMGNFESARIDVGMKEAVVVPTKKEFNEKLDQARKELSNKLQEWKTDVELTGIV